MNIKSLVILVAFVIVGAGAYFYSGSKQTINASAKIGSTILPNLQTSLNSVDSLEMIGANNKVLSTIIRSDSEWTIKQRNNYPADISKVRAALLNLAEAKIVEEKTSNPDLYNKLGVEDVSSHEAQGVQVIINYANQSSAIIIGKPGPQINKSRYVRAVDDVISWLIDRKIDLKHEPEYWLKKDILSVEPSQVASVEVKLTEGGVLNIVHTGDEENTFEVINLTDPSSRVIDPELHQITNALSSFQLLDVVNEEEFKDKTSSMNVKYQLKSGVIIDVFAYDDGTDRYASVEASLSTAISEENKAASQAYVDSLNNATSGWVYKIPNVSYDSMYKSEEDVLAITEDQLN